jgi:diguanylate cyclase (GGDEF)-like protein
MDDAEMHKRLNKLKTLRATYSSKLPQRMLEIEASWEALLSGDTSLDVRHVFHRLVHGLAGSAGTFGYNRISQMARQLENIILRVVDNHLPLTDDTVVQVATHLAHLKSSVDSDVPQDIHELMSDAADSAQEITQPIQPIEPSNQRLIFLLEDDDAIAEEMTMQRGIYGWEVRTFANTMSAKEALGIQRPAAVIVDIMLPEGDLAGAIFVQQLNLNLQYSGIPTIVVSSRWDWESRLSAVQAGVDAYYVKPIDFAALAERLDILVFQNYEEPFRVLIVEDECLLAEHYAEVLRQANMHVCTVVDPIDVLNSLDDFEPELLLLDLYMPSCNGTEMAKVIRQDEKFNDVPIVFLSTESGRQLQLTAMQSGADDFLQKPISNAELISAVTIRASRFRALRQLIRQDSMTGSLNHIALKLQLEIEIARHQRSNEPLSVVMLDLDKFKSINDTYGHQMGDRVIKSAAKLLHKRLRKTDIIGRYGGEEFAVVMAGTGLDEAVCVMNKIREQFSKIHHSNGIQECVCTFSAGVSAFPTYSTVTDMLHASDLALYQAKTQGRNQVCVATNSPTKD